MSKIITIIILILAGIAAFLILTGKKTASKISDMTKDNSEEVKLELPTDAAEIALSPSVVDSPLSFHDPTTDYRKAGSSASVKPVVEILPSGFFSKMTGGLGTKIDISASAVYKSSISPSASTSSSSSSTTTYSSDSGGSSTLHSRMGVK